MDVSIEWEGALGLIKLLLVLCIPFLIGFIVGRVTKK